jgi:RNA polymerase sigma factor (sigma-70 family)
MLAIAGRENAQQFASLGRGRYVTVSGATNVPAQRGSNLELLYRAEYAPLMRIAYLMTSSNEAAEDAVHETFLRCAPKLAEVEHPPSYLRAALLNECRSGYRRRAREQRLYTETQLVESDVWLLELQDALRRLSYRQRAALVMRYFVDLPEPEIAHVLGCRPSTVRSLIRRGLANLREVLA